MQADLHDMELRNSDPCAANERNNYDLFDLTPFIRVKKRHKLCQIVLALYMELPITHVKDQPMW